MDSEERLSRRREYGRARETAEQREVRLRQCRERQGLVNSRAKRSALETV